MRVLVAYATSEGQTRKIASTVAEQVRGMGHDVVLHDTAGHPGEARPDNFDKIVLAGSVHEGGHQQSLGMYVTANRETLSEKPTLFLSVSLSAAFADGRDEAQAYVDRFAEQNGWIPNGSVLVAGATHAGEYDYFETQVLEHVVLKDRSVDGGENSREFTDWAALAQAVEKFIEY